jgi:holo-[acyl-carrier protein] synthase
LEHDPSPTRDLPTLPEIRGADASTLVGADVVDVAQVAHSIGTFGERYLRRVFTDQEVAHCTVGGRDPAPHLAARFAAKEAAFKALRAGDAPFDWRWIEVRSRGDGSCGLLLHRGMRSLAKRRGVRRLELSMSHDGAYAIAVVVGDVSLPRPRVSSTSPKGLRRTKRR